MQNLNVNQTEGAWSALAGNVSVPHTEEEYNRLVSLLDHLIDEVGEDESHPLASLMEVLGVLIERYEDEHVPELTVTYLAVGNSKHKSVVPRRRNKPRITFIRAQRPTGNPIRRQ
jgi:HTH-type transcriptional regulator/antitoxin HigA